MVAVGVEIRRPSASCTPSCTGLFPRPASTPAAPRAAGSPLRPRPGTLLPAGTTSGNGSGSSRTTAQYGTASTTLDVHRRVAGKGKMLHSSVPRKKTGRPFRVNCFSWRRYPAARLFLATRRDKCRPTQCHGQLLEVARYSSHGLARSMGRCSSTACSVPALPLVPAPPATTSLAVAPRWHCELPP